MDATRWTPADEAELSRMLEKRKSARARHLSAVQAVAGKLAQELCGADEVAGPLALADSLVLHAEELRDVLMPFDSGRRADVVQDLAGAYARSKQDVALPRSTG